ncbi:MULTISPECIES: ester cyclase [unclassified Caballeronia]|uniref:ester cyclase n=1 Tax=unclassified Caballeronia TaxID=2646786 RepID=UPI0028611259|nr:MULTISPECIES: ester cyclase [unclassified Caballeronia]MDR5740310.1 ester cyclase [Caballeronia sp. LZ016]MDR5808510.1 ester cyclase [Caballeronia sp. LZ019]
MERTDLAGVYRGYIACLNEQNWPMLGTFVHDDLHYNGQSVRLADYRQMLERDFRQIPDLRFNIRLLAADPPFVACRLWFDCTPARDFLGLAIDGRRVSFAENVFYEFREGKIAQVWSVIDKAAIEAQLRTLP